MADANPTPVDPNAVPQEGMSQNQKIAIGGAVAVGVAGAVIAGIGALGVGGYMLHKSSAAKKQDASPLKLNIALISAENLVAADSGGTSDPYVIVEVGKCKIKSSVKDKTVNPVWNEQLKVGVHENEVDNLNVVFKVEDKDFFGDDAIGEVSVPLNQIPKGNSPKEFNMQLQKCDHGKLKVHMWFTTEAVQE